MSVRMPMNAGACKGQRHWVPHELELQVSARALYALKHRIISPAPTIFLGMG